MQLHYAPTYAPWFNQLELWFAKVKRDLLARGIVTSVTGLARKLRRFITTYKRTRDARSVGEPARVGVEMQVEVVSSWAEAKGAVLSPIEWLRGATAMVAILAISVSAGFAQTTVSRTGTFGGQGGGPFELACPAGSVMTGLRARHGSWIDALAPICSVWVRSSETLGEIDDQPFTGGDGGGPAFIRCAGPRGVVVSIEMFQADNTDRSIGHLRLNCGDYKQPEQFRNKLGGSEDYFGQGQPGPRATEQCGPGMVAAGLFGKSGAFIDRLGLLCIRSTALATVPSSEPGKSIGRVPSASRPTGPARSLCEAARDARARNSPAAPNLEAQCRATSVIVARIAVLRANGEALVKEGGLSAGWITEHTDVIQVAMSGNRIAVLRKDGEALVKEGGLSTGWTTLHTDVTQVALSGDRIAVLRANGEALVKEGGLSAGWITEHTDVIQVALSGDRIAVLRKNGEALVKEGGLSAGWITEHTDVIQVALSGDRIAVLRANGEALVKEGGLSAGWITEHTDVIQVALSGDRIAVLRKNGEALVKEGGLSAGWITEHTDVIQVALSGDRIAVLRKNGEALVKEGGLSAGWITEHTDVIQMAFSGHP